MKKKYPFIKQDGLKDCGVSSLLMIIKYYHGNISKERLRELTKTNKNGTTAYNLIEAARMLGFRANGIKCKLEEIENTNLPCIAYVTINDIYKHYIVIYKINFEKKELLIADPADKIKKISFSEFEKIYNEILITPSPKKKIPVFEKEESFFKYIKNILKKHKNKLIIIIGLYGIFQIISQLFYQFWQVSFLDKEFSKTYFGLLYVLFQIVAIFSNALFSRHNFSNLLIPLTITLSGALLISIFTPDKILFLIFIIIFLVPFNVYNNQLIVNIQKESDSNIVASVISLAGTVSSIISMIVLWIIGILNNYFEFWFVEVVLIAIFIILSLFLLILYSHQKKLD